MTVRPIRLYGDPVLTTSAKTVSVFDNGLRRLVHDMQETMEDAGGVGLAANQIGVCSRVFVFDCQSQRSGIRGALVNPVWIPVGADTVYGNEGCLSIPGIAAKTERYAHVIASGQDVDGRPQSILASGLLARCIQHETDHLNGKLFVQRLEGNERKKTMAQIRGASWFNA